MYQGKVGLVHIMVEIVIVIVHLRGGQLSLVHNVLGRQGADVKTVRERTLCETSPIG